MSKALEASEARKILFMVYNSMGKPAGVRIEAKTNKKTQELYYEITRFPMAHLGIAKAIRKELIACQGITAELGQDIWNLFSECLAEISKSKPYSPMTAVRERLPLLLASKGGLGPWRMTAILRSSRLYDRSSQTIIENDRIHAFLVKMDEQSVIDHISGKIYPIQSLEIVKETP